MIDRALYDAGIARLIARVRRCHESECEQTWTATRRRYEAFAQRAEEFSELMAEHEATDIESVHDERGEPVKVPGPDGWPVEIQDDPEWPSMQGLKWRIRDLADSARIAAERLPGAREKHALPMAARGLLHLRHDCGFQRPALSNESHDVCELDRVCRTAGIILSRERLRGALAESLKTFDSTFYDGFDLILYR